MNSSVIELKKLINIQSNLEISAAVFQDFLAKHESEIFTLYSSLKQKRETELYQLRSKIDLIQSELKNIYHQIENFQTLDLQMLKKEMTEVQEDIQHLRQDCKINLENLNNEENLITEQLYNYENKLLDWEKTINTNLICLKGKIPSANRKKFAFEVKEYLDFVNQYGLEGGWETEDHNLFLKVRTKIKDPQKIAKYLNSLMPDKSIEVILEHENWYQKYLNLKEKQRDVIKQWRSKTAPVQGKNDTKPILNIYHKEHYNREENARRISKWKDEKQKRLINKEKENQKNTELQKKIEENKKMKYQKTKNKVTIWKIEKQRKHLEEKLRNEFLKNIEKEQKSTETLKAIKLFQSKDDEFIEKMKKKRTKQVKSSADLIQSKITAPRDPKRLFKPTKQWMQRSKRIETQKVADTTFPMDIKQVPKLCLPLWRKGVPLFN